MSWLTTLQNVTHNIKDTVDKVGEALDSVPVNRTNFKDATAEELEVEGRHTLEEAENSERDEKFVAFSAAMKGLIGARLMKVKALKKVQHEETGVRQVIIDEQGHEYAVMHALWYHLLNKLEAHIEEEMQGRRAVVTEHTRFMFEMTSDKERFLILVNEEEESVHLAEHCVRLLEKCVTDLQHVEDTARTAIVIERERWFSESERAASSGRFSVLEGSLKREAETELITIHEHKNRCKLEEYEAYSRAGLAETIGRATITQQCKTEKDDIHDHFCDTIRVLMQRQLTQQREWSLDLKQLFTAEAVERSSLDEEEGFYFLQMATYLSSEQAKVRSRMQRLQDDVKVLMNACKEDEADIRSEITSGEDAAFWQLENSEKQERYTILDTRVAQWDEREDEEDREEDRDVFFYDDPEPEHDPEPDFEPVPMEPSVSEELEGPSLPVFESLAIDTPPMAPTPPDDKEVAVTDLKRRYDSKKADGGYESLLAFAVYSNSYTDTVLALETEWDDLFHVLLGAIREGYTSSLRAVVRKADLTASNSEGMTGLHVAVQHRRVGPVMVLLEAGSPVNVKNAMSSTPLHIACKAGDQTLCEILHQYGADKSLEDASGKAPYCYWPNSDTPHFLMPLSMSPHSPAVSITVEEPLPPPVSPEASLAIHSYNFTIVFFSLSALLMWFYVRG